MWSVGVRCRAGPARPRGCRSPPGSRSCPGCWSSAAPTRCRGRAAPGSRCRSGGRRRAGRGRGWRRRCRGRRPAAGRPAAWRRGRCRVPRGRGGRPPLPCPRRRSPRSASSSWGPQSQRSLPKTSPVRHSLCTRVSTGSPSRRRRDVAVRQRDVLAVVDGDAVAVGGELAVPGGQPGLGDALDVALVAAAVAHQVLDRDHREAVLVGELAQLRGPLHRAVVVDDLDEHAGGREAGQPGEVDGRLGVPAAHQHAALAVAQREHVARAGQLPRLGRGVGQRPRGVGAVGGADAGGDAVAGVDRDRVGRAQLVLVVRASSAGSRAARACRPASARR